MPIMRSPESEYSKEMARWNKPYRFEKFPQMLYKAQRHPTSGKWQVACDDIVSQDKTMLLVDREAFGRSCQMIANNEAELERARSDGWRESPKEALGFQAGLELDMATAAAHRNYEDRGMSAAARDEAMTHELNTDGHVAEIPRQKRPYSRRKGAVNPAA